MKRDTPIRDVSADDWLIRAFYQKIRAVSRYFDVEIHDIDRLPEGGAMLVGNHALLAVDTWALLPELYHRSGRVPRGMGLRALFDVPVLSEFLRDMGMEPGDRETATELLERGELVITYPGGAKDALKSRAERFELKWGGRRGFAHVAIEAGSPVVPIAGLGPDECFPVLVDRGFIPCDRIGMKSVKAPLFVPLARRVPFDYFVGEPIEPPSVDAHASVDERDALAAEFARLVQERTQELLREGHARRQGEPRRSPRRERVRQGLRLLQDALASRAQQT